MSWTQKKNETNVNYKCIINSVFFFSFCIIFIERVQVMLLGDTAVGKTCLLVQFKDKTFLSGSFIPTVGIDFRVIDACKYLNHALQISAVHCQLLQRISLISALS